MPLAELLAGRCTPLGRDAALDAGQIAAQLVELPRWQCVDGALQARYGFADYHETISFVNALAWIVHAQDHHPDLAVGYDRCTVRWSTHSAGGITINDFICAARADAVFERR
jgi:4a-hydroxytetrahydrobiopterin dehydratase